MRRRGGGIIDDFEDVDIMNEETGFQSSPSRKKYNVKNPMEDIESKSTKNIEQKETYSFANGGYFQRRFVKQHSTKNSSESAQTTPKRKRRRDSFSSDSKENESAISLTADKKRVRSNESLISNITTKTPPNSPILMNDDGNDKNNQISQNLNINTPQYNDNDDEDVDADVEDDEYDDDLQKLVMEKKENEKKKHKNRDKNKNKNRSQTFLLESEKPPYASANGVFKKQDQDFLEEFKKKQESENQKQKQSQSSDAAKVLYEKQQIQEKTESVPPLSGNPSQFSLADKQEKNNSQVNSNSTNNNNNDNFPIQNPRKDTVRLRSKTTYKPLTPDTIHSEITLNPHSSLNNEINSAEIVAQSRLIKTQTSTGIANSTTAFYQPQQSSNPSLPQEQNLENEALSPLVSLNNVNPRTKPRNVNPIPLPNSMYPSKPKQFSTSIPPPESPVLSPTSNITKVFDEERRQLFGEKLFEKAEKVEQEKKEKEMEEEEMKHKYGEAPEVLVLPAPSRSIRKAYGYRNKVNKVDENEEKIPISTYTIDSLFASASYSISESFAPKKPELNVQKLNEEISKHYKTTVTGINEFSQKTQVLQMSLSNTADEFNRVSNDADNISDKIDDIHKKTDELIEKTTYFPTFKESFLDLAMNVSVKLITFFIWIYFLLRNVYLYFFGKPVSVDIHDIYILVQDKKKWIENMKEREKVSPFQENKN